VSRLSGRANSSHERAACDDGPGAHRRGPDPGPGRRIADPGRPPARPCPHPAAAGRLRRRRADRRRRPRAAAGGGVLTARVAGRRRDPLRRGPRAGPGEAEGPHPPRRRPADLDRCPDHLVARHAPRRAAAGDVPTCGHHDRRDPRGLGADGRGTAAQIRASEGPSPAHPDLGRLPHRPGRWRPGSTGLPRGRGQLRPPPRQWDGTIPGQRGYRSGRRSGRGDVAVAVVPGTAARRGPRHHGAACRGDRCGGGLRRPARRHGTHRRRW
jgi:hypothetical protein